MTSLRHALGIISLFVCLTGPLMADRPNIGPAREGDNLGGVEIPLAEITPATWGLFYNTTAYGDSYDATIFIDAVNTFDGDVIQNYVVGIESNNNNYYGIIRSRALYVFDTAGLNATSGYNLVGTYLAFNDLGNINVEVFDAGDFGLEIASPFPGGGANANTAHADGPAAIGSAPIASPSSAFEIDVTDAIRDDLGGGFSGFLLGLDQPIAAGTFANTAFANVGLNTFIIPVPIPTLGEWGLIAFVLMLTAAGVFMMRQRKHAGQN